MKRTAFHRRTPLARAPFKRRAKPMRQRSPKRRHVTPDDRAYMDWIRTCACCAPGSPTGCNGDVEAHHAGVKPGRGLKAPDDTCIPLCHHHHINGIESGWTVFRGWTRAERREWQDGQIVVFQALWAARQRRRDIIVAP